MIAPAACSRCRPEHFDFAAALDGAALLHLSGITPALGPGGVALAGGRGGGRCGGRADLL
jgi:2-dehydro-3-deoxygluconokinase